MDKIDQQDLTRLIEHRGGPHISIFLPTERAGAATRKNVIRFKNLLRAARERLEEHGVRNRAADELLEPATRLIDRADFWQHQDDGLAVFLAPGLFASFRLPLRFEELAAVEDRFHLKSLFPLFSVEGSFYILALSQKKVRLFEGSRYAIHEVPLEDVPESLAEALGHDLTEPHLQLHSGARAGDAGATIFHGQGAGEEDAKAEIRKFFSILDRGLREYVGDREAPLVLAGVDYLLPIYRRATSYPHTLERGVTGSPDELSTPQLHARAWQVVETRFLERRRALVARYGDLAGTGLASSQLDEVTLAAVDGRVDALFVASGVRRWGRFDPDSRHVELVESQQHDTEDLLDLAAVRTFASGGTVYAVDAADVPGGGELAAIFRW